MLSRSPPIKEISHLSFLINLFIQFVGYASKPKQSTVLRDDHLKKGRECLFKMQNFTSSIEEHGFLAGSLSAIDQVSNDILQNASVIKISQFHLCIKSNCACE